MGYLFISYSRQQIYFAESVALHLQQAGFETWFDLQKLAPGQDWGAALEDGYGNCERLILVTSQAALRSPYVAVEWETALRNGREVILVLAEAVVLPESVKTCPVYDARGNFEKTMDSLTATLRGKQPPRYDPVPAPRKSPLPDKMPRDIWFTLSVLLMPTITVWIATLMFGPSFIMIDQLDFIETYLPGVLPFVPYLVGFFLGFVLAYGNLPVVRFLRHETSFEELEDTRNMLFGAQILASLASLAFTKATPFGYLILIFPLATAYWFARTLRHSPDLLRWLPSGQVDQEVREGIQGKLVASTPKQSPGQERSAGRTVLYALHHHPADKHNARFIDSAFQAYGCRPAPEDEASHQLIIVSNRTSKHWLLERNASLPGQIIHILATNIHTPDEIKPVLRTQWVDFRSGRTKVLRGLANYLTGKDRSDISYGMQISPTGFDNNYGFPRMMRLVLGAILVVSILAFIPIAVFFVKADWTFFLIFVPYIILVFYYVDALTMRKAALPALFHKILKQRVAWFASPAAPAADPIGNTDRKYLVERKFLMFVDILED